MSEEEKLPHPDSMPDLLDKEFMQFALDGVVHEAVIMRDHSEVEAVLIALATNFMAYTTAMVGEWQNQGSGTSMVIGAPVLEGMLSSCEWAARKLEELLADDSEA